nr:protein yippee-like isoform X1 [Solanum lycopersicum]
MGRLFVLTLEGNFYSCKHCGTHLALSENIVSKSFRCRHGKAYLFSKVVNVTSGEMEDRVMMTGVHTVADIFCVCCGSIVGWKYETAHEMSQKYKEGKSVLERLLTPPGTLLFSSLEMESRKIMMSQLGTSRAHPTALTSRSFHCRHGKAYLFSKVVNVTSGEMEGRVMMTGLHTVADIFCVCCGSIFGWKYETAHEMSQKYKEGKSVLERFKICGPDGSHYSGSHDTHVAGSDADDV